RTPPPLYTLSLHDALPISLLTGDTNGEVMAVKLPSDPPTYRWKAQVDGSHAAVAYSADQKKVYATTAHGVCILDATTGQHVARRSEVHTSELQSLAYLVCR